VRVEDQSGQSPETFDGSEAIQITVTYQLKTALKGMRINLALLTEHGELAFLTTDHSIREYSDDLGTYRSIALIPGKILNRQTYIVGIGVDVPGVRVVLARDYYSRFTVGGSGHHGSTFPEPWPGVVSPEVEWRNETLA
jgi:hypothetical protein